ncbi:hypothetical protein SAY86_021485 [Trapa natans]|uniref:Transcription repressor n=1 Tax=Trapa natans TaxID=22666 RepID=A0AAN7M264_TRANT|nr:hypothetical protein SAY86_021485 [Trapa natans]
MNQRAPPLIFLPLHKPFLFSSSSISSLWLTALSAAMRSPDERTTASPLSLGFQRWDLNLCFSKIKLSFWPQSRLPSPPLAASTTSLIKTFNSLYDSTSNSKSISISSSSSPSSSTLSTYPDLAVTPEPDLSDVYASRRFFFSSPGRSNSIVESLHRPVPRASGQLKPEVAVVGGGVAIPTYSPDPYADFRRSMQEMVDARQLFDVNSNWECLHEMLLCYLSLNPKSAHKFIVGAFADLLVSLMCEKGGDRRSHRQQQRHSSYTAPSYNQRLMPPARVEFN